MLVEPDLHIGLPVVYFDDDKEPHAAIVARILFDGGTRAGARPRIALTWLGFDARWKAALIVEPAYHDGVQWILLQKWAFQGEVNDD